ncbi:hypothetical protein B9Z55_001848 [Caenorhabditis nigoni]|uniref:Uncharacterized protein n=1 Tax=Caenorhabditis nigoni TaxID=1611254 RepID=A0A2G5VHK7_9PELO|nr:hypothetical protein B9Z55_001848 [Caenorhabditis nigoni]
MSQQLSFKRLPPRFQLSLLITKTPCSVCSLSSNTNQHPNSISFFSGDSVQDVSTAMMFCNCPNGFSRQPVEVWSGQDISLNYKCL